MFNSEVLSRDQAIGSTYFQDHARENNSRQLVHPFPAAIDQNYQVNARLSNYGSNNSYQHAYEYRESVNDGYLSLGENSSNTNCHDMPHGQQQTNFDSFGNNQFLQFEQPEATRGHSDGRWLPVSGGFLKREDGFSENSFTVDHHFENAGRYVTNHGPVNSNACADEYGLDLESSELRSCEDIGKNGSYGMINVNIRFMCYIIFAVLT